MKKNIVKKRGFWKRLVLAPKIFILHLKYLSGPGINWLTAVKVAARMTWLLVRG